MQETQKHFDEKAEQWDREPRRVKLAGDVVDAMRRELPLDPAMEALDYGCGSGLVTLGLHPYVGRITGADNSTGMLEVLKRKVVEQQIGNVQVKLLDLERQGLDATYDLVVGSMVLHHVKDVPALIGTLAASLRPGGWLALADLESEGGDFHDNPLAGLHHGFSREFLAAEFGRRGLSQVRVMVVATIEKGVPGGAPRRYPVLLCVGRKG